MKDLHKGQKESDNQEYLSSIMEIFEGGGWEGLHSEEYWDPSKAVLDTGFNLENSELFKESYKKHVEILKNIYGDIHNVTDN